MAILPEPHAGSLDRFPAEVWVSRGLALLRIVAGYLFLPHGSAKFLGFPMSRPRDDQRWQREPASSQCVMPISVEHERLRQAAVDLLEPDVFESTSYDDITRRAAERVRLP